MKDLTKDSILRHILVMAAPVALSMFVQIAYQLVDLYFVARIGAAATAGINAAGTLVFIVGALIQILGIGTAVLVAQAAGRNDSLDARLIFNQALTLALVSSAVMVLVMLVCGDLYLQSIAADKPTIAAGATFLRWMLPGYALMLPMTVFASALRGAGAVQATVGIYAFTVIVNIILAPVLIAGWGTGVPLGVAGAGLSSTVGIAVGIVLLAVYFHRSQRWISVELTLMRPSRAACRRILFVGLPAAGEFILTFLSSSVVYYCIREFGADAQAGFGVGSRVVQTVLLPGMAIAFAVGPIAGQNFGARKSARVRETFSTAAVIASGATAIVTIIVQWRPVAMVALFGANPAALMFAAQYLQLVSWAFVAQSLVYVCSSMFQGLGNTTPALVSSGTRSLAFIVPAVWLSTRRNFEIEQIWYLFSASVVIQAAASLWLLRMEMNRRLFALAN